jgi:hypothetical protein
MPVSRLTALLKKNADFVDCGGPLGCVLLPGMVGYGATVWDLLPTYPPRFTEHGAPGGSALPPHNYGT